MSPPEQAAVYLTTHDVAEQLRVSDEAVRRWVRDGKLRPSLTLGGKAGHRFVQPEVDRFLAQYAQVEPHEQPGVPDVC